MVKKGMDKKIILSLAFVLLLLPTVFAYDVAYISKTSKTVDQNIVNSFSEMNLSVGIVLDKDVAKTDFSKYNIVLVSDDFLRETPKYYDITKHKTIVVNKYYGIEFGLTDDDGVSQLASTSPQDVILKNSLLVQVYTQARYFVGGESIPYYYLGDENKADGFQSVARADNGNNDELGDVISVAEKGLKLKNGKTTQEKICFFGIAKTDYWTPSAKELFKDECVGFVAYDVVCSRNSDCDDSDNYTQDTCVNPGTYLSRCEHKPIRCLTELDCGVDGFNGNKFCSQKNVLQNFIDYTCNHAGTPESSCTFTNENKLVQECSLECTNGKCFDGTHDISVENLQFKKGNQTINNNILVKGDNYNILIDVFNIGDFSEDVNFNGQIKKGSIVRKTFTHYSINNFSAKDSKIGKARDVVFDLIPGVYDVIVEGSIPELDSDLSNNKVQEQVLVVNCISNSDCNENEICINPGTENSYCQAQKIECNNNLDCGVDGFTGDKFCSGKDVKRKFLEYECNVAGTPESYCSSKTSDKLIEECSGICSDGSCAEIKCRTNEECDDGNSYTIDECVLPGTIQSSCRNSKINCAHDSDCGFSGFLGNEYCSSDDVFKNYQTAKCHDAGTKNSYCSLEVEQKEIKKCDFACLEGTCVRCNENSDCDDGDSLTKDVCMMPNTVNSYCENKKENVECTKNSDCGVDGFIENQFCEEENVFQKYITYKCNNAGTPQSYCSDSTSTKLKENCNDCGKFTESFNSLDAGRWNLIKGNEIIEGGRLKAVGVHGNITDSSAGVLSKWKLHGDFDIQVDYDATAQPASDSSAAIALTVLGTSGKKDMYTLYDTRKMDGSYEINSWTNQDSATGKDWNNENSIVDYSSGSFRIKRIGTTMYGYQKQGSSWVEIAKKTNCDVSDMVIYLRVYDNLKNVLGFDPRNPVGYFDNFAVNNNGCSGNSIGQCSNGQCKVNICGDTKISPSIISSGIKMTAVSQNVNNNAVNSVLISVENLDSFSKTIEYKRYLCRCQEHSGDLTIPGCYEFWPLKSSCELTTATLTLAPNEKKNIELSTSQYQNMKCGSFQMDASLISVNGVPDTKLMAWSFADLCMDCSDVE